MSLSKEMPALNVAYKCRDAYSADFWGPVLWVQAAQMLFDMGFDEKEVEWVLRSKMTRWARDDFGKPSTYLGALYKLARDGRDQIMRDADD